MRSSPESAVQSDIYMTTHGALLAHTSLIWSQVTQVDFFAPQLIDFISH